MAAVAVNNLPTTQPEYPPTPQRALKRSASTASLLSPPASERKPRASKRLRAIDPDDGDVSVVVAARTRPKPRIRKPKGKAATTTVVAPTAPPPKRARLADQHGENDDEHKVVPRPCTPPPRVYVPPASIVEPHTPPRTAPKRGGRIVRDAPLRDSPNNPFLVERSGSPIPLRSRPKRGALDFEEGPIVKYVFRGIPQIFANPYANQHPPSPTLQPTHPSFLPLDHPDFSPSELTRPQLLFPHAHGYANEGESPCAREPPSTPKRERAKTPMSPVKRSLRKVEPVTPTAVVKPVIPTAVVEAIAVEPVTKVKGEEPKTPELPRTPPRRTKTSRMTATASATAAGEGEVRVIKTRSKTTSQRA
ncbi:hypothetical protein FRC12_025083 [Ceratobasidium sp. 428]|nr:hypothetical protein FRC12_025083 [Ceratobasidium sp. 428]